MKEASDQQSAGHQNGIIIMKKSGRKAGITNRVVNNSIWIISERVIQAAISFFVNIAIINYLPTESWGAISYCASFVNVFLSLSALGLEYVVIKELTADQEQRDIILGSAMAMRLLSGVLSVFCVLVLIGCTKGFSPYYEWIGFLVSLQLIFKLSDLIDYYFQSRLESKNVSIAKIITYVVVVSWRIFILATGKSEAYFAFAYTLDSLVVCAILFFLFWRQARPHLKFSLAWCRRLLHQSKHFILASMISMIYSEMDRLMLGTMIGDTELAVYTTAYSIAMVWVFIPNAIMTSYRPAIMEGHATNTNYIERIRTLYSIIIWIGIAAGIAVMIFGKWFIGTFYKEEYLASVPSLYLLIWSTLFSHLAVSRSTWLVCEGLNQYSELFPIWGVIVNLILNIALIPSYGATGAAAATLVTQFVVTMIAPLFYKKTRPSVMHMVQALFAKDLIDRIRSLRHR